MKNGCTLVFKPFFRFAILLVVVSLFSASVYSQTAEEKKALKIAQTEAALQKAKEGLTKAERKVTISDSLTDVGIQQGVESKDELRKIEGELKALDKEFNGNVKSLKKQIGSKDQVESLKATSDLKETEVKYKLALKESDVRAKLALKKEAKASADEIKGKTQKKPAEEGLAKAQAALDVAQAKYDMASGTTSEPVVKPSKVKEKKEKAEEPKKNKKENKKDKEKEAEPEAEKVQEK